jgi:hypothetical protein
MVAPDRLPVKGESDAGPKRRTRKREASRPPSAAARHVTAGSFFGRSRWAARDDGLVTEMPCFGVVDACATGTSPFSPRRYHADPLSSLLFGGICQTGQR